MSALTTLFSSLANKIRSKTGGSDTYTPPEMVDAIDDVYDAVFEKLKVTTNTGKKDGEEKVLFTTELSGTDKMLFTLQETWEKVLFWFLKNA